ncbi:hypothetical protein HF329_31980 [Chitinophaga oryzae]|uniref:RHS repeat-associated core domain-containing protein n=1 Tax=Chitinophaga oryzae TaxID=2725414 RepID=A0AAE6ZP85_9BACT|nr:hypothetical protein HF329_31980 [Chitinophaga oryzae]
MRGGYRYGFNGKENDNEIKGEGNQQDYGFRIYDPRIAKFLSVDPITKQYPELTPYQFASNRPIDGIDQDGLEYAPPMMFDKKTGKPVIDVKTATEIHTSAENGKNLIVGGAMAADVYFTGGMLSMGTFAASVVEHNPAKTPEGRAAQNARGREALANFVTSWGLMQAGRFVGSIAGEVLEAAKESPAVRYLFRGTSEGFEGLPSLKRLGITPTSSDPVVSTVFATNAENYGKGILQIAMPESFQGVEYSANVLSDIEREIAVGVTPAEFTSKTTLTITSGQAREILSDMGIKVPSKVKLEDLSNVIRETPRMNTDQINEFYKRASQLKK